MDRGIVEAIRDWCRTKFQPIGDYAASSDIPTLTSQLTNDNGYITEVPAATQLTAGVVKVDGDTITIDKDGIIHAVSSQELAESILGGES